MGQLFFWMNAPDTAIAETDWSRFLSTMAAVTIGAILIATTLAIVLYAWSARARKIYSPSDVFRPYKPLWWIALAAPAGIVVFLVCVLQYLEPDRHVLDILGEALQMGFITAAVTALLAYFFIAFVPGITPAKFMYRPALFRHRK